MRIKIACILLVCCFLAGCSPEKSSSNLVSSDNASTHSTSSGVYEKQEIDSLIVSETTYDSKTDGEDGLFAAKEDLKIDYLPLKNLEEVTDDLLKKAITSDGVNVFVSTNTQFKSNNSKNAIGLTVKDNVTWGQTILSHKLATPLSNGLNEEILIDPVDGSLEGYQGIRFYVYLKRPEGREFNLCKIRMMFGSYSNYRSIYEYSYIMPDGDYKGYINIPFNEMKNGYTQKLGVSTSKIDYFGFNISLEGSAEDMQVYLSDFQAYREMFW